MILLFLRLLIILYLIGLFVLLFLKLSNATKKNKGISSLFLFPLLLCSKNGRKTLIDEVKKGENKND